LALSGCPVVSAKNVVIRQDDLDIAAVELAAFEAEPLPPQDWDCDPLASPPSF
jgi:hypothetical protein